MADMANAALFVPRNTAGPQPAANQSLIAVPTGGNPPTSSEIQSGGALASRSGNAMRIQSAVALQNAKPLSNTSMARQQTRQPAAQVTTAQRTVNTRNGTAAANTTVQRAVSQPAAARQQQTSKPQLTKPPPRTAVVDNRNGNGDSPMANGPFGQIVRMDEAFGVGMRNPVGQPVFARGGGIRGPITIGKAFTWTQNSATVTPILLEVTLTAQDQAQTGSERYIYQLSINGTCTGAGIPAGFDSVSLTNAIMSGARIVLLVGGVPQAQYSNEQLQDTKFVQRGLDVEIYPDPGNFLSTAFRFEKPGFDFPLATAMLTYTFSATLVTYWSLPGSVRL